MAVLELSALLAFVTAICYAGTAMSVQIGMRRIAVTSDIPASFTAALVSIVVSVAIFWLVTAVRSPPLADVTLVTMAPFVVAGILYPAVFRLGYFKGIDRIGASVAAAIVAGNPAVAAVLAVPILGERLTVLTAVGIAFIVAGGAILQLTHRGMDDDTGSATDLLVRELSRASPSDLLYPIGAMVAVGVAYVFIKLGLTGFPHPPAASAVTQTAGLAVFVAVIAGSVSTRHQVQHTITPDHRTALGVFALAGVLVAIGWLAQFFALQLGSVVIVIPLINTFPLVIVVLSYVLARELPRSPHVLVGILSIIAGATILQVF